MPSLRLAVATVVSLCAVAAVAANDDPRARAILDRVAELSRTTRHWQDRDQTLALQITDRKGGVRDSRLQMWTKRYADDTSRSILVFRDPPPSRGIGVLQWVDPRGPDRQWVYYPSGKRVRQITGARKTDSFLGTDFSFEDLGLMMDVVTWTAADATSTYLRDAALEGIPCAVIDLDPAPDQEVSYAALRLWIGVDDHLVHRYEFLGPKGVLKKTLVLSDMREVAGIPSPHHMEMVDAKAGSRSTAIVESLQFNLGLDDDVFTKRRLERGG
jgi:hypothetical protein